MLEQGPGWSCRAEDPCYTARRNAVNAVSGTARVAASGFLESRTATTGPANAISTQLPLSPLAVLRLLLRQDSRARSTVDTVLASLTMVRVARWRVARSAQSSPPDSAPR